MWCWRSGSGLRGSGTHRPLFAERWPTGLRPRLQEALSGEAEVVLHLPAHEDRGGPPVGRCCEKPLWGTSGGVLGNVRKPHSCTRPGPVSASLSTPCPPRPGCSRSLLSRPPQDVSTLQGRSLEHTLCSCLLCREPVDPSQRLLGRPLHPRCSERSCLCSPSFPLPLSPALSMRPFPVALPPLSVCAL